MPIFYLPVASAYGQNIKPSDGAKLYFYTVGTTTLKTVYTDAAQSIPSVNPVIADGSGRWPVLYISGNYKIVITDKNDVQIYEEDDLRGFGDSIAYQGDFDSSTNAGDYPASGDKGDLYKVSEAFTLNAASGTHVLIIGNFIIANKDGATGIDADWDIIKGQILDEDDFASDSAVLPPSQQSAKAYIASQILDEDDFASDSPTKAPSQQSTKAYIATQVLTPVAADVEFKGVTSVYKTTTTVDFNADKLKLVKSDGTYVLLSDVDQTFNTGTDLYGSASLIADQWYQEWLGAKSDGSTERLIVPELEAVTDGTTANELVDSGEDFTTFNIAIGDEVFNDVDGTKALVNDITNLATGRIGLDADIFVSGESYRIHITPVFSADYDYIGNVGRFYIDSSGTDIDNTERFLWYLGQREYAYIWGQKATTVAAGGSTAATWNIREFSNFETNMVGVSLATNRFSTLKGEYDIDASAPALQVNGTKVKLYNYTDTTDELIGSARFVLLAGDDSAAVDLKGKYIISSKKEFELQHYTQTAIGGNGLGKPASDGTVEIYAQVKLIKRG